MLNLQPSLYVISLDHPEAESEMSPNVDVRDFPFADSPKMSNVFEIGGFDTS